MKIEANPAVREYLRRLDVVDARLKQLERDGRFEEYYALVAARLYVVRAMAAEVHDPQPAEWAA